MVSKKAVERHAHEKGSMYDFNSFSFEYEPKMFWLDSQGNKFVFPDLPIGSTRYWLNDLWEAVGSPVPPSLESLRYSKNDHSKRYPHPLEPRPFSEYLEILRQGGANPDAYVEDIKNYFEILWLRAVENLTQPYMIYHKNLPISVLFSSWDDELISLKFYYNLTFSESDSHTYPINFPETALLYIRVAPLDWSPAPDGADL